MTQELVITAAHGRKLNGCAMKKSSDATTLNDPLWWNRYNAYLKTTEWAAKRNAVIDRAHGVCEGCLSARATQAHHLTYDHVGAEFLWELRAVCEACHDKAHPHKRVAKAPRQPVTLMEARANLRRGGAEVLAAIEAATGGGQPK